MNFYLEVSNIVKLVKIKSGSVKSLVYSSSIQNKKALYALVCESLRYHEVLSTILKDTALLKHERSLRDNVDLGVVLLYEHLLGKGVSGKWQEVLKRHKNSIHSQCELMKIRAKVTSLKELVGNSSDNPGLLVPKYVRVNTIKTDMGAVCQEFMKEGWTHVRCTKDSFKDVVSSLAKDCFTTDPHIPDLLVFPSSTDFHDNTMYTSGEIILQDKASCFPAYMLSPEPGSHVIDCCAAPGNKTCHLAALMNNKGKIFAFDKDPKRLATLESLMKKVGATCVRAKCQDFLTVDPGSDKYRKVEYILLDPSCSGTGMVNRWNEQTNEGENISKERLQQLSKFQITILKHACKFPKVKRIVYSTCSIHEEENERVVEEVMSFANQNFRLKLLMPDWTERGVKGYEHAQCCLRMSHDSALTNGFFVACFERKEDSASLKSDSHLNEVEVVENNGLEVEHKHLKNKHKLGNEVGTMEKNGFELKHKHKKLKKTKQKYEIENETKTSGINDSVGKTGSHMISQNETQTKDVGEMLDTETLKHEHRSSCRKKRKRSKQRDFIECGAKSDNDIVCRHSKPCKKKRKKSKQRDLVEDGKRTDISNASFVKRCSNACKKKRKKSKQRDIIQRHVNYEK